MKKVAFCFLIYDKITFDDAWFEFFKNADPNKYTIHIHYVNDITLKYFNDKKIKKLQKTNHGDITLSYAYNLLFKEALKDEDVYKMCILSNSCIPFKSFDYVYEFLTKNNYSYFNQAHESQCFPKCEQLIKLFPKETIAKSSGWFTLNRIHAKNCVGNEHLLTHWQGIFAPEEYYFLTICKNTVYKDIVTHSNIQDGSTHFINWSDMGSYPYTTTGDSVKNYSDISSDELNHLFNAPCLFGRKFLTNCTVDGIHSLSEVLIEKFNK